MKKGYIVTAAGLFSVGFITSYLLSNRKKRNMIRLRFNDDKKFRHEYDQYSVLEEAGIPDQLDHRNDLSLIENAKMVSEGSQFGVHYYNMVQDNDDKDIQH